MKRSHVIVMAMFVVVATGALAAGIALGSSSQANPPDRQHVGQPSAPRAAGGKCRLAACAHVDSNGMLLGTHPGVVGATEVAQGVYCVELSPKISALNVNFVFLTVDYWNSVGIDNTAQWYSGDPGSGTWCTGNTIAVKTYAGDGGTPHSEDIAFTIGIT